MRIVMLQAILLVLSAVVYLAQQMLLASKRRADWVGLQLILIEANRKVKAGRK